MGQHIDNVPRWVRIAMGIIALLSIAYGVICYWDIHSLFHNATGVDLSNWFIKNAGYEYASRNLAIGLALGFITIIRGAPEALTILTIVRALIEIQTIIISAVERNVNVSLLLPLLFLILEILMIKTLIGVIKKEEAERDALAQKIN